jgi:hypothetical protein
MFTDRSPNTQPSDEDREIARCRLVDDAFNHYLDWRQQSSTCQLAYRQWTTSARSRDSAIAFAAYTAALDREEQAAAQYETALCGS